MNATASRPDGREVKSHGEVVIGTLLHAAGVPFKYEVSFPLPDGKAGGTAGADAPQEDLRGYRPDFYLPDDPEAPVTAEGGVWLEHYAHDRSGRAPAEFAGYEEVRAWKRRLHERFSTRYVETSFGDLQRAWNGAGPGMAEVLVERLRAVGVEIDDPERWTVEAADDVGDGPDAEPGPLTLEVDAWIGAVRRWPAGRPPPTASVDVGALRRIGGAVRRRYEQELADTGATDHDGTILEAECAWIDRDLEQAAQAYAVADVVPEHLAEVRAARLALIDKTEAAVKDRLTKEISYWDHRAAQLALEEETGKTGARLNSGGGAPAGGHLAAPGCRSGSRS